MLKYVLILCICFTWKFTAGQIIHQSEAPAVSLRNENDVLAYINQTYSAYMDISTSFSVKTIYSPAAIYYTVKECYSGLEVYNTGLKICTDKMNSCKWIKGDLIATQNWQAYDFPDTRRNLQKKFAAAYQMDSGTRGVPVIYCKDNGIPEMAYLYTDSGNYYEKKSLLLTAGDSVIASNDNRSYFTTVDTTVTGKVFMPDPLTTANTIYGGNYTDNSDSDNTYLNDERYTVAFTARFDDDIFYLQNENIVVKDFASPFIAVETSAVPVFEYTRSNSGFEDVNAFYHITNFNSYIKDAGYESMQDFYLELDTHGAAGADQSFFTSSEILNIQYGEGGVDDAEDADVLLHEYGHALSYHASPETNSGFERRAIDEGYGDYFAVSYSRSYSDFNWQNVFSWDGHNEFWNGRNANSDRHYPEDITGDYYVASEIWSGALMDIYDAIGKTNTDILVFECLYGSVLNMTLPDAAQILLSAEEMIFGGSYHDIIFDKLYARGLLTAVDISENGNEPFIFISNTYYAAFSNEPIFIHLQDQKEVIVAITDMQGRKIYEQIFHTTDIALKNVLPEKGIYFLTAETTGARITKKIIAF